MSSSPSSQRPCPLSPTDRPQAIHGGLQSASAPSYIFHSPTSGSSGIGLWHGIIISSNQTPQDSSSDPGSGVRASEAVGSPERVSVLQIRSREGERPGTQDACLLVAGRIPALTKSLYIQISLPAPRHLNCPGGTQTCCDPDHSDCHPASFLLLTGSCHGLQRHSMTGGSGRKPVGPLNSHTC